MKYKILEFDEQNHSILVSNFNETKIIKLPIIDGKYYEDEELDNYIASFFPIKELIEHVAERAENSNYIKNLVDQPFNISNNEYEQRDYLISRRLIALDSSDWTQLPDVQEKMSEKEKIAWKNFRQELRDLTQQPGWPNSIVWPKRPNILGVTIL